MHPDCRDFMAGWDRFREGRTTAPEHAEMTAHLDECRACADRYRVVEGIGASLRAMEMAPFTRRRIAVAAADFRRPVRKTSPARRIGIAAAVGAASAAIAVFLLLTKSPVSKPNDMINATPPRSEDLRLETVDTRFTADGRREIALFPGTSLFLSPDAVMETVSIGRSLAHFRLHEGRAVMEIGAHNPDYRFIVSLPHSDLEARGTVFSVTCTAGEESVRVTEGLVELRGTSVTDAMVLEHGDAATLQGDRWVQTTATDKALLADRCLLRGEPVDASPARRRVAALSEAVSRHSSNSAKRAENAIREGRLVEASKLVNETAQDHSARIPTVRLLARLARAYRSAKMYTEAKNVYLRMIRAYPDTETAADGLVALGQLEYRTLGLLDEAMSHFDRYLTEHPKGLLAETARAERIRVLQSRGNHRAVIAAADEYIAAHRSSFSLSEVLRRRGDAFTRLGRCAEARTDYEQVISRWPGTQESVRAEKGIAACR